VLSAALVIEVLGAHLSWVNLFIMVPVLLLVGEITPKTLAIRSNVAFAKFQCRPIAVFATLIAPIRWLVRLLADWVTTRIVGPERSRGNIITEDLVRTLAHEAVGKGALDHMEAQFIDHIFEFGNKSVEEIMTPRSDVFFLPVTSNIADTVKELRRTWQTRIPVYEGHRDRVLGILHARDLVGVNVLPPGGGEGLRPFLRETYFVPETKPAVDLFQAFRTRRLSVAVVVDEFGGVTGLVTMSDVLQCIFGEATGGSSAQARGSIEDLGDGVSSVDGAIRVADFNRISGADLQTEHAETLGGLLLHLHGELPRPGSCVQVDDLAFEVTEVLENRIRRIQFERAQQTSDPAPGAGIVGDHESAASSGPRDPGDLDNQAEDS
jgi:CBS domain containing-hemolysin-like protein